MSWVGGFFDGAGTVAGSIGDGLLAAMRPQDPRYRNPTGVTPEQVTAMQQGQPLRGDEPVELPKRPGLGESLLALSPLGPAADAWKASNDADQGGYAGGKATGEALANLAMVAVPGGKAIKTRAAPVIRAYHGSPNDFHAFDINRAGSTTDPGSLGRAIYASTDPKVAEPRAHKYELSISPQNPLNVPLTEWEGKAAAIRGALGLPPTATAQEVTEAARAKGYDATILDYSPVGYHHKEIAAYDPSIIEILRKYGLLPVGGGAAAAATVPGLLSEKEH